jgi:hypothetical protein
VLSRAERAAVAIHSAQGSFRGKLAEAGIELEGHFDESQCAMNKRDDNFMGNLRSWRHVSDSGSA